MDTTKALHSYDSGLWCNVWYGKDVMHRMKAIKISAIGLLPIKVDKIYMWVHN